MVESFSRDLSYGALSDIGKDGIQELAKQGRPNPSSTIYNEEEPFYI
jgi:hypothetical protein